MPPIAKKYPVEQVPPPSFNFVLDQQSSLIRSTMTTGRPRQRRKNTEAITLLSTSWVLNADEWEVFRAWFNDELKQGVEWFSIPLKIGPVTREFIMRFTDGFTSSHKAVNNWEVAASLEIYDMHNCGFDEVQAAVMYYYENPERPPFGGPFVPMMGKLDVTTNSTVDSTYFGKHIYVNSSANLEIELPENNSFNQGDFAIFARFGNGTVEFVPGGANVVIRSDNNMRKIDKLETVVVLVIINANTYHLYGDLGF